MVSLYNFYTIYLKLSQRHALYNEASENMAATVPLEFRKEISDLMLFFKSRNKLIFD
jgi:hypothetical protein